MESAVSFLRPRALHLRAKPEGRRLPRPARNSGHHSPRRCHRVPRSAALPLGPLSLPASRREVGVKAGISSLIAGDTMESRLVFRLRSLDRGFGPPQISVLFPRGNGLVRGKFERNCRLGARSVEARYARSVGPGGRLLAATRLLRPRTFRALLPRQRSRL